MELLTLVVVVVALEILLSMEFIEQAMAVQVLLLFDMPWQCQQ
jgi:hypothetical protein